MPYNEHLTLFNQLSLSSRHTRTDLIIFYKILHDLINSELKILFVLNNNSVHNLCGLY